MPGAMRMVTATGTAAMATPGLLRAFASQGIVRQNVETGVVVAVRCVAAACNEMVSEPLSWIKQKAGFSAPPATVWVKSCCLGHRVQVSILAGKKKEESIDFPLDNDIGQDEDDEVIGDMEEWMCNKPVGFGNTVYDTTLEEKLLAEIEHDKKSRMAAAMGLKDHKGKSNGKKSGKAGKAMTAEAAPPAGVEVWVGNVPRKKNVDRDLWAALRSIRGLLHIRPIVFAQNEKTREPLCKGFAFLTFKTDGHALDFVAKYHGTTIAFGRVEKKLACEVAVSDSPWSPTKPTTQMPVTAATEVPKLHVRDIEAAISPALSFTDTTQESAHIFGSKNESLDASVVPVNSSDTSSVESFDEEEDEQEQRALGEKIWLDLEDEADDLLDMELEGESQKTDTYQSTLEDIKVCGDPPILQSTLYDQRVLSTELVNDLMTQYGRVDVDMAAGHASEDHEKDESVSSKTNKSRQTVDMNEGDAGTDFTVTAAKTSKKISEGSHKEGDKGDDEGKRILELELRVRQMEHELIEKDAKLRQVTAAEQQRIEMIERRVLGKFNALAGTEAAKMKPREESTRKEKGTKAVNPRKSKSVKPSVTLGSASRLKLKERKVLTDVMSKYASDSTQV